ncbi:MAG: molybdopterin molybdotransferase MoeA [Spirochaetia bacterium]|nr:molybdopterin molybdotransferase MoeA [Spirochaetia bacterium]
MISIEDARSLIHSQLFTPKPAFVELENSQNYFLAEDINSDRDYPPFNRAAVDGYAVRFSDIDSGLKTFHIAAEIYSGEGFDQIVEPGRCIKIMTGAALPQGFDILFKVEHCEVLDDVVAIPEDEIKKGLNISQRGENVKKGEIIIQKGTRVDEKIVHSLAAAGIYSVPVFSLPRVHIISTGNEIVAVNKQPSDFQIRDSNYFGLAFQLAKFNIKPESHQLLGDDKQEIRDGISTAIGGDILILSGGVSMGDRDFVPEILTELGVEKVFHKVNIKPGKPFWFGRLYHKDLNKTTFVFALPGNPFSTLVTYKIFIEPWLYACFQNPGLKHYFMPIVHEKKLKDDRPEYFPVKLILSGQVSSVEALRFHGSGDITATAGSDGLAFFSGNKLELVKGDPVEFIPWN